MKRIQLRSILLTAFLMLMAFSISMGQALPSQPATSPSVSAEKYALLVGVTEYEHDRMIFACSTNEQAFEHDDWGHGAFTYAFLQHASALAKNGSVTSGTLSDQMSLTIENEVKAKTKGRSSQTMYALTSGTRVNLLLKPDNSNAGAKGSGDNDAKSITDILPVSVAITGMADPDG